MAHPYAGKAKTGRDRARLRYADGGSTPEMDLAKSYIRGMKILGSGTWSGKDAFQRGADDAKAASDRMRPGAPQDKPPSGGK